MSPSCLNCGGRVCNYTSPMDGEPRCIECAHLEISGLLSDMDPEDIKTLRRRIEDCLLKNPRSLARVAENLIISDQIKWIDLV